MTRGARVLGLLACSVAAIYEIYYVTAALVRQNFLAALLGLAFLTVLIVAIIATFRLPTKRT